MCAYLFSPFAFGSNKRDLIVFIVRFYRWMLFFMAPSPRSPLCIYANRIHNHNDDSSLCVRQRKSKKMRISLSSLSDNQIFGKCRLVLTNQIFDFQTNQFIKLTGICAVIKIQMSPYEYLHNYTKLKIRAAFSSKTFFFFF